MKHGKKQLSHLDLSISAAKVRTFDHEEYTIKGALAINNSNGDISRVPNIYYDVRHVINHQKKLVAKRKNRTDELCKCHQKKVK